MQDGRPEAFCCPQRLDGKHSVPPRDPTRGNPLKADHNEVAAVRDRYLARTSRLAGGEAVHVGLQCSSWNLIGQLASGGWSVSPV